MGIRKRGSKWLVTAEAGVDEFGVRRRICRSADTEDEAKRLHARLQHEVYEGKYIKPSSELVPAFCRRYLDNHADAITEATFLRYQAFITTHVEPDLGRVTLAAFKPKVAVNWKRTLFAKGLSPSTVRKLLIFVGAAMALAVAWKLIADNPLEHVELPSEEPPPFHVYTAAEQAALLSAAAPSDGDPLDRHRGRSCGALFEAIAVDLGTGLRRGELLGLELEHFDRRHGRLHVRRALTRTRDGEKCGPCKTARSRRSVVLSQSLVELLDAYVARRIPVRTRSLFLNVEARQFSSDGFESSWRKVRERAAEIMRADAKRLRDPHWEQAGDGVATGRFHDLRHTHATELLRAGVHIKVVAERLGDSEVTVMRTYSHVLPDMQEAAAAAIEPLMRGLLPGKHDIHG